MAPMNLVRHDCFSIHCAMRIEFVKEELVSNSTHHKGVVWHQNGEDMVIEEMDMTVV
jgi:hypothetical protein